MLFKENNKIPGSLASNHISNNSKISLKPRSKRSLTLKSASTELLGLLPTKKPEIVPTFVILSGHELIQHISKLEEDENPEKNEKKVEKNQIEKDDQNQISEKDESTPQEQPETEDVECQTDDVKNGDKKKKKPIHKRRRRASLKALKKKQKKFYDFELSSDCDRLPVPDFCEFQTSDSDSSEFLELLDDDSIEYFANLIGPINQ
ncbi:hypothetical protein GPJ56_000600 [Histomonas meleagridis]|uniref:uncharacterized protein n=1 Tax=Histomonas meleagridis TaxID=135588 RepID=UPI00355A77CF|nr:hypothetical protein GPJ56_000600 [Histomonas meleagridis]KAH0806382.1 hypothetical protein GO595_000829 [Histomonas meleagridis]